MTLSSEPERLGALHACEILDTAPDPELDLLVAHAARLAGAPIALISLVAEARQWFKAKLGIDVTEGPRQFAFCAHAILQREPFIVRDARTDVRFADNPYVTGDTRIAFYGGWPLVTADGHALGTLCVLDHVPRELSAAQRDGMALLARQVVLSIELRRARLRESRVESPLSEATARRAELEQLVATRGRVARMVVHDLKNPLTVIGGNTAFVLETSNLDDSARSALEDVIAAATRMQAMLLDILDVGRSFDRDGGLVAARETIGCRDLVDSVVGSGYNYAFQSIVKVDIARDMIVAVDKGLVARVVSNLVDNAQRYAPAGSHVVVTWRRAGDASELVVSDAGPGVRDEDKPRIFDPYVQVDVHRMGRGLGLSFCRLAAEAHGGSIRVEDNQPRGSKFCVRLPEL